MTDKTQKIMDVAKPGTLKSTSGSGRPVIVTNRPVVQDPMVSPAATTAPEEDRVLPTRRIVIKPLDDSEEKAEKVPAKAATSEVVSASDTKAPEKTPELPKEAEKEIAETPTPEEPEEHTEPEKSDEAVKKAVKAEKLDLSPADEAGEVDDKPEATEDERPVDAPKPLEGEPDAPDADKPSASVLTAQQEAEAKAQAELDEMIESKDYNLPINEAAQRRSRYVAIFGAILILLLAAAWVDIALDSGILKIPGVHAVTYFFAGN